MQQASHFPLFPVFTVNSTNWLLAVALYLVYARVSRTVKVNKHKHFLEKITDV